MKALINPNEEAKYVSAWNNKEPVYTVLGQRVCDVAENEFPVAEPLFWLDCNSDVVADLYYYDTNIQSVIAKPQQAFDMPPQSSADQPTTTGTQTI